MRSLSSRSRRRSTTPRSARTSSSSIAWASRAGRSRPGGCGTRSSRNARITCSSASAFRKGATSSRSFAPPWPEPGHVGELHRGVGRLARVEHRRETLDSRVGNSRDSDVGVRFPVGVGRGASRALVMRRNRVVFAGRPESYESGAQHRKPYILARSARPARAGGCSQSGARRTRSEGSGPVTGTFGPVGAASPHSGESGAKKLAKAGGCFASGKRTSCPLLLQAPDPIAKI